MSELQKEEIIKKYFNTVYKLALNQTKKHDLADDVTQDVFLRFVQKEVDFKSEEHIKAWLIRVTVNCCKNVFASSWFKKTQALDEEIPFETSERSDVYYATLELPQKYRVVIHLFYYEDMSVAEISKILGCKESAVKTRLHRARLMLQSKLKGGYEFV